MSIQRSVVILSTFFVLLLLAVSSMGCASMNEDKPGDPRALEEAFRAFHINMRWARWEHASDQVHEAYRQEFLGRYEELGDDFQIVDMDLKSVEIVDEGFAAIIEVEQEWHQLPSTVIEKERFVERWVYSDGRWSLRERLTREAYRENGRVFHSEAKDREERDRRRLEQEALQQEE